MSGRLVNALNASTKVAEAFSDEATLRHMLRFEAELAQAAARAGLIPKKHAVTIAAACDATLYDPAALVPVARRSMTLTVAVVKALTAEVRRRDEEAAAWVHWGATSQDVLDTAMVLQLCESVPPLIEALHGIVAAFARLARKHRATPMMGRTLCSPRRRSPSGRRWRAGRPTSSARRGGSKRALRRRRSCSSAARPARCRRSAGKRSR